MTLNELGDKIVEWRKRKGFDTSDENIPEKIALIHSELSEALECIRNGYNPNFVYYTNKGKPEGFSLEMADTIIRILDLCRSVGIDIDKAVEIKMDYNETRPPKHGKKF